MPSSKRYSRATALLTRRSIDHSLSRPLSSMLLIRSILRSSTSPIVSRRPSHQALLSHSQLPARTLFTMPPKAAKRKSTSPPQASGAATKRAKTSNDLRQPHPLAEEAEKHGIVLRKYYPHEMSNARARAYNDDKIPRPMEELVSALEDTSEHRKSVEVKDSVVHWFKMDLRHTDNKSLALAGEKASEAGVPLICVYIVSPQDFEAHLTSPVRVDFMLRTLEVLRDDLAKLDIPLYVETVAKRKAIPDRILELMEEWGSRHLFANIEYEVDELRREAQMVRDLAENGKSFDVVHDSCIVAPGQLQSGAGRQYAVYTPWYRTWVAHVHDNLDLLELFDPPAKNPADARKKYKKLFECPVPEAPQNKGLSPEEKKRFRSLWPCGEHAAKDRLRKFCDDRVGNYHNKRNIPADEATSSISVHLASGTISARTCVRTARDSNRSKKLNSGNEGIQTWISEVAWRDFYKHVLVNWPFVWYAHLQPQSWKAKLRWPLFGTNSNDAA